jgi:hypothetical protein
MSDDDDDEYTTVHSSVAPRNRPAAVAATRLRPPSSTRRRASSAGDGAASPESHVFNDLMAHETGFDNDVPAAGGRGARRPAPRDPERGGASPDDVVHVDPAPEITEPEALFLTSPFGVNPPVAANIEIDPSFCFLCELGRVNQTPMLKRDLSRLRVLIAKNIGSGMVIICQKVRQFCEENLLPYVSASDTRLRTFWHQDSIGGHIFGHAARRHAAIYYSLLMLIQMRDRCSKQVFWIKRRDEADRQRLIDFRTAQTIMRCDCLISTRLREFERACQEEELAANAELLVTEDECRSSYSAVRSLQESVARDNAMIRARSRVLASDYNQSAIQRDRPFI